MGVSQADSSGKESPCQCRNHKGLRLDPWVGNISWRRAWQPTPVFLSGQSPWTGSLEGYGSQGCKESDMTEPTQHPCNSVFKAFLGASIVAQLVKNPPAMQDCDFSHNFQV